MSVWKYVNTPHSEHLDIVQREPWINVQILKKAWNFAEMLNMTTFNYFSYSAIRNLIRHAIYFKLKNVIFKTLIRMTL